MGGGAEVDDSRKQNQQAASCNEIKRYIQIYDQAWFIYLNPLFWGFVYCESTSLTRDILFEYLNNISFVLEVLVSYMP